MTKDFKVIKYILWLEEISKKDIALVGGKNASLGEMYSKLRIKGVNVPQGFALTANSFWHFLKFNQAEEKLKEIFSAFNPESIESLKETGKKARDLILKGEFPIDLEEEILDAYKKLSIQYSQKYVDVVKSVCKEIEERFSLVFEMIGFDDDHVHFMVQSRPKYSPSRIFQIVKSLVAREIFARCPEVKKSLWGGEFWSDGGYVGTVGEGVNADVIRDYIKKQGRKGNQLKLIELS